MTEKDPHTERDRLEHDISELSVAQRRETLERVFTEKDEEWASEALLLGQRFTAEEQERLVSVISDPNKAYEVLTLDYEGNKKLTPKQSAYLMEQLLSDVETAYIFYMQLVESGIAMEPDDTEREWLEKLEMSLLQTEDATIAAYMLEHATLSTPEDRERLEKLIP